MGDHEILRNLAIGIIISGVAFTAFALNLNHPRDKWHCRVGVILAGGMFGDIIFGVPRFC